MKKVIVILSVFFIAGVCVAQNASRDIPKGLFKKVTIPKNSYNPIFSVYHAGAVTLAREWDAVGFTLQNDRYATGIYPPNSTLSTKSKSIILPQLNKNQKLILQLKGSLETESGYDYLWILVSADGGNHYTSLGAQVGKCDEWNQTFDLSMFAGKEIFLSFCLNSDESIEGSGCSLDAVDIFVGSAVISSLRSLENEKDTVSILSSKARLQITGIGTDKYPDDLYIYFTATNDEGNYIADLKQENIMLTINEKPANSCMELQKNTNTPVDIAFLVDNSGSMHDPSHEIKESIDTLINKLSNQFDARAGLYRFAYPYSNNIPCPGIAEKDKGKFFWDLNSDQEREFLKNDIWEKNVYTGSIEKYYEAFHEFASMTDLDYNDNAKKVIIMLGNEGVSDDVYNNTKCGNAVPSITQNEVIDELKGRFTVINIVNVNKVGGVCNNCYEDFFPISDATGGLYIDIYGDYGDVINKISEVVSSNYVLRVNMNCLKLPAKDSCTSIIVSLQGHDIISVSVSDTICRNLKESVVMRRTESTVAKDIICVNPQDSVSLGVYFIGIPTEISPDSIRVTAYISDTTGREVSIIAQYIDNSYYITVPKLFVNEPYFQYRFQAEVQGVDRLIVSPNGSISAWTVAVCENYPPVISNVEHTCSDSLQICADITDVTQYVNKTRIYYRKSGTVASYSSIEMTHNADSTNRYCATIPSPEKGNSIEYYVYTEDNYGSQGWYGTPELPNMIFCDNECISVVLSANPITSQSHTLSFTLREASWTTIYLADESGDRITDNLLDKNMEAGSHEIPLDSLLNGKLDPLKPYILVIDNGTDVSLTYLYVSKI